MNSSAPPQLLFLVFFSLFHIPGGFIVGRGLRQLVAGTRDSRSAFLLIWGVMFGGIPLCIGAPIFALTGAPQLFAAQVGILIAAVVAGLVLKDEYLEAFAVPAVGLALFGGALLLAGIALVIWAIPRGPGEAVVIGSLLGAGGLAIVAGGLISQLKGNAS